MIVYVSGPYSAPTEEERQENVTEAIRAGIEVIKRGHVALIPHLTHFVDETARLEQDLVIHYEEWMRQDLALLERCDALLFLASSPGADRERQRAEDLGQVIYDSIEDVPWETAQGWSVVQ